MARASGYLLGQSPYSQVCASVMLDPGPSRSFYVSFEAYGAPSAPPIYELGAYTTDGGKTWRPAPTPSGMAPIEFGGFRALDNAVDVIFGTAIGDTSAFQTADGGVSWTAAGLSCPASGPCAQLGAARVGNCAKGQSSQSLLVSRDAGSSWRPAPGIQTLFICSPTHLAGLADGRLMLLIGNSEHPLQISSDGGVSWKDLQLPLISGQTDPYPAYSDLQLLPDGSLLSAGPTWRLLKPGASDWCPVAAALTGFNPIRVGDRLYVRPRWVDSSKPAPEGVESIALADLRC